MVFNTFGRMNRLRSKYMVFGLLWILCAVVFFAGCEKDSDGPMNVTDKDFSYDGEGYFLYARLDSGKTIHLSKDTLYLDMGRMWTFSNCALKSINLTYSKEDSVLWIAPTLSIHATAEDCAAPYFRPDTTLKLLLSSEQMSGVGVVKVKNESDSLLDSILLRRGSISRDTFEMYLDSVFTDVKSFPLRTKEKIDFFVQTQTPPIQGVFYDGQLWDARALVLKLVAGAKRSLILIDNLPPPSSWTINGIGDRPRLME